MFISFQIIYGIIQTTSTLIVQKWFYFLIQTKSKLTSKTRDKHPRIWRTDSQKLAIRGEESNTLLLSVSSPFGDTNNKLKYQLINTNKFGEPTLKS